MLCIPAAKPRKSSSAAAFGGGACGLAPIPVIKGNDRDNMNKMENLLSIKPPRLNNASFLIFQILSDKFINSQGFRNDCKNDLKNNSVSIQSPCRILMCGISPLIYS